MDSVVNPIYYEETIGSLHLVRMQSAGSKAINIVFYYLGYSSLSRISGQMEIVSPEGRQEFLVRCSYIVPFCGMCAKQTCAIHRLR